MSMLVENLSALAVNEGYNPSFLSGVGVYRSSESSVKVPLCYPQGIIFVAQGQKRVFFDSQVYCYNPDNYLVLTIPLPAQCETIVEDGKPLLSLLIDLDVGVLSEIVRVLDEYGKMADKSNDVKGLYVSQSTGALSCVIERLSACLTDPMLCEVIGPGLLREIFFHVLTGPQAMPLYALVSHNTHLSRIERVLKHLNGHFEQQLDVDQLAGMANMSVSTFHRNFKQVTASSPIQYVKKLRLNRARDLLVDQGLKVSQAALEVGYDSASQFSREFSRYFGSSPSELHRA